MLPSISFHRAESRTPIQYYSKPSLIGIDQLHNELICRIFANLPLSKIVQAMSTNKIFSQRIYSHINAVGKPSELFFVNFFRLYPQKILELTHDQIDHLRLRGLDHLLGPLVINFLNLHPKKITDLNYSLIDCLDRFGCLHQAVSIFEKNNNKIINKWHHLRTSPPIYGCSFSIASLACKDDPTDIDHVHTYLRRNVEFIIHILEYLNVPGENTTDEEASDTDNSSGYISDDDMINEINDEVTFHQNFECIFDAADHIVKINPKFFEKIISYSHPIPMHLMTEYLNKFPEVAVRFNESMILEEDPSDRLT